MERRLTEDVVELVRQYGPGARLPSERDLCDQLNVSRTALRDRLQVLVGLGVLRRKQGSGTYVQYLDPQALSQALDLAISALDLSEAHLEGARIALERQAAIEAARERDSAALAEMAKSLAVITYATDPDQVDEADFAFHVNLVRASGNEALVFFTSALSSVLRPLVARRRAAMRELPDDRERMIETHGGIYSAVAAGDPAAAAAAIDYHFEQFNELVMSKPSDGKAVRRAKSAQAMPAVATGTR